MDDNTSEASRLKKLASLADWWRDSTQNENEMSAIKWNKTRNEKLKKKKKKSKLVSWSHLMIAMIMIKLTRICTGSTQWSR